MPTNTIHIALDSDMLVPVATLILGLILGGVGKILFERYKFLHKRIVIASALASEANSIIIDKDYTRNNLLGAAAQNRTYVVPSYDGECIDIYMDCKNDIGYLPSELASDIVQFYGLRYSLRRGMNFYCNTSINDLLHRNQMSRNNLNDLYRQFAGSISKMAELVTSIRNQTIILKTKRFLFIFPMH